MIVLERGPYTLPNRDITLDWDVDLDLSVKRIYHICGENGLGKTSFLEQVLVPALRRHQVHYLFLGQDMGTQLYTLRASLAVVGHGLGNLPETELLKLWVRQGSQARVFVLDEFDKYYPDHDFIFQASRAFIDTYVFVSHQQEVCTLDAMPEYELRRITFERTSLPHQTKRVHASMAAS